MHTDLLTYDQLTTEQSQVIDTTFTERRNTCVTGPAGTGKSAVLKALAEQASSSGQRLDIVGTTGIAAVNVGGCTLHSWASIPFDTIQVPAEFHVRNLERSDRLQKAYDNITKCKVLAIDEISMLSAPLLDYFSQVCSLARGNPAPFGGITLVGFGDFLQLPPVGNKIQRDPPFAFEAEAWARGEFKLSMLTKLFRQADPEFGNILSKVRMGLQTPEVKDYLNRLLAKPLPTSGNATIIHTHNKAVDDTNNKFLDRLPGEAHTFAALDWDDGTDFGRKSRKDLERNCLASTHLRLVVGARVMCLRNISFEREIINGTCGTIIGFEDCDSRASLSTQRVKVKFDNGETMSLGPETWETKLEDKVVAKRKQIPLRVAYAITAHKAQGLTLDSTVLFLNQAFAYGQGYVALSRCKTFDGTYLRSFNGRTFRASRPAVSFYMNPHKFMGKA